MVPDLEHGRGPSGNRERNRDINPLMAPLFRDVAQVLDTVCQPIARALRQYNALHSGFLATLHGDLAFYLAAVRLMEQHGIMALPVLDGGRKLVGMVHLHDLMKAGAA